jgi:hypothetical protein
MIVSRLSLAVLALLALALAGTSSAATGPKSAILWARGDVSHVPPAPVELWTTDGHGAHARRLAVLAPTYAAGSFFLDARFSPDGSVIYAVRNRRDPNNDDLVLLKHGRSSHLFTVRGLRQFAPSPDGTKIAYSRALPVAGRPEIVVADLDGTRARVVAGDVGSTLSWSSDGLTLFAYGLWSSGCGLCAITAATGAEHAIGFPYQNMEGLPEFAPSGARFAFCDLKGPAGERIYTRAGKRAGSYVGICGDEVLWGPTEDQLLLQDPGPELLTLATGNLTRFRHSGPADLHALDWTRVSPSG